MQARQRNIDYEEYLMSEKDPSFLGGPSPFGKLKIIKTPFDEADIIRNDGNQVKVNCLPHDIDIAMAFLLMKYKKQIKSQIIINTFNKLNNKII